MILKSVTVRNFRIHRELHVELDPFRTVIGGPNESGKSTLMEAAHQALFLKAKITGEERRKMQSWNALGQPEVEVVFSVGDRDYRISKRFSGQSGTSRLVEVGGRTWQSEEAEEKLAALLGAESGLGGRGAGRAKTQWAHVFVRQGEAGKDPSEHAENHRNELMTRLQLVGGAVVQQSELDAQVAAAINAKCDELFTSTGNVKKNSELDRATRELQEQETGLALARESLQKLEGASLTLAESQVLILEAEQGLPVLERQKKDAVERRDQATRLQRDLDRQTTLVDSARVDHVALADADQRIKALGEEIRETEKDLEPRLEAMASLEDDVARARQAQRNCEEVRESTSESVRLLRRREKFLETRGSLDQAEEVLANLNLKNSEIEGLKENLEALTGRLRPLPVIKPARLKKLEAAEHLATELQARLCGMATGVEVLDTDRPVTIGGESLTPGVAQVLTEDVEMIVGESTRIRIRPGGGDALRNVRADLHEARDALEKCRESLEVRSAAEAREIQARRRDLEQEIKSLEERLEDRGAESIAEECAEALGTVERLRGELERAREVLDADFLPPAGPEEARDRLEELRREAAEVLAGEKAAEAGVKAARERLEEAIADLEDVHAEVKEDQDSLQERRVEVKLLRDRYGDDETRAEKLAWLLRDLKAAEGDLERQQRALDELQPELIAADLGRLDRSIEQLRSQKADAGVNARVAQEALRSDGFTDPVGAVALAEAACRMARERHARLDRESESWKLLRDLFQEEQEQLAERFTEPLAARISDYLGCVYGPGTRARLTLASGAFSGIEIVRRDHGLNAMPFEPLSGGTKEQVAVAVRLAIAEILAEDQGGHLPIVLDDAFAYSDRNRIQKVQRMLDLAAQRGLQVIVLTCTPGDYVELGARQAILQTPAFAGPEPGAGDAGEAADGELPAGDDESRSSSLIDAEVSVTEEHRRALLALLNPAESRGNISLRHELGWGEDLYRAVKEDLVHRRLAISGHGRGGSLRAAT